MFKGMPIHKIIENFLSNSTDRQITQQAIRHDLLTEVKNRSAK